MTDLGAVRPNPVPAGATANAAPAGPGGGTGLLGHLAATARRSETPCGDGSVVWHGWGAGGVVVLLHGTSGSWRRWVRNISALARDHRVLAPDIPGLGESADAAAARAGRSRRHPG